MRYELVEVEADGTELLVSEGTFRKVSRDMAESIEEALEDYDERGYEWPTYRVQPAS
jgi:hypothetical protein